MNIQMTARSWRRHKSDDKRLDTPDWPKEGRKLLFLVKSFVHEGGDDNASGSEEKIWTRQGLEMVEGEHCKGWREGGNYTVIPPAAIILHPPPTSTKDLIWNIIFFHLLRSVIQSSFVVFLSKDSLPSSSSSQWPQSSCWLFCHYHGGLAQDR